MKNALLLLIFVSTISITFGAKKSKGAKVRTNDDYSEFYEGGVTPDYAKKRKERIESQKHEASYAKDKVLDTTKKSKNTAARSEDADLEELAKSKSSMSAAIAKVQGGKKPSTAAPTKMGMLGGMISKMVPAGMIQNFMKDNPFSKMNKEEVKGLILKAMNPKAQKIMKTKPNMLNFLTDLVHDKNALPAMMGMLSKEKELKICGGVSLILFILSIVLNILNSKGNLFKKLAKKMAIMFGLLAVNIGCFYYFFHNELSPALGLFRKNFF